MIECAACKTLNPDAEAACLSCGAPLTASQATGISGATGRCPAGHPVDPTWTTCPYCERQAGAAAGGRATRLEEAAPGANKTRLEPAAAGAGPVSGTRLAGEPPASRPAPPRGPNPTRLEVPPTPKRPTVLHDAGGRAESSPAGVAPASAVPVAAEAASAASAAGPVRRMLAVLAAPDLGPGGAVFAVRSGRNTLGADRGNDIVLDADTEVSREHAVILHRNGTFHLADRLSTNGTWINGEEVPANGTVALEDRDRIRVGRTDMVFLRLDRSEDTSPD